LNILIVDDDQDIAKTYGYVLSNSGHRATMVFTAEECLKIYTENLLNGITISAERYDLLILDYKLPDRNGFEVAREIVAINPDQKIIFVTAYTDILQRHMEKFRMSMEVLEKPVPNEVLLNAIQGVG
jgi:DNA-binding response OmpR family regulator